MHKQILFVAGLVLVLTSLMLVACGRPEQPDATPVRRVPTWTPTLRAVAVVTMATPTIPPAATTIVALATPTTQPAMAGETVLPAPLYFIDSTSGQITRLERDGDTFTLITHEPAPVLDFDLSPVDGHLVYVSDNDLIESNALGNLRHVLVAGPAAPVVDLRAGYARYGPTLTVSAPRFSPDGQQLVFGLGGIKIMATSGMTAPVTVLASDPYTPTSNTPNNGNYYLPYAFSPDGSRLLVEVRSYWEGVWWGILEQPGQINGYVQLPVCCDPVWSPQGDSVYLSNVQAAIRPPSLHRWLVASGELIAMLDQVGVAFPHVNQDGTLLAFAASGRQAPTSGLDLLALHRLDLSAGSTQLVRLRTDEYNIWNVLWARDESGVLIVERNDLSDYALFTGLLIWVPTDGSPAHPLRALGSRPHWGL
jgi:hypothetical protein